MSNLRPAGAGANTTQNPPAFDSSAEANDHIVVQPIDTTGKPGSYLSVQPFASFTAATGHPVALSDDARTLKSSTSLPSSSSIVNPLPPSNSPKRLRKPSAKLLGIGVTTLTDTEKKGATERGTSASCPPPQKKARGLLSASTDGLQDTHPSGSLASDVQRVSGDDSVGGNALMTHASSAALDTGTTSNPSSSMMVNRTAFETNVQDTLSAIKTLPQPLAPQHQPSLSASLENQRASEDMSAISTIQALSERLSSISHWYEILSDHYSQKEKENAELNARIEALQRELIDEVLEAEIQERKVREELADARKELKNMKLCHEEELEAYKSQLSSNQSQCDAQYDQSLRDLSAIKCILRDAGAGDTLANEVDLLAIDQTS
ncbi:hypothetical protein ONZ45_g17893 [Pleurotus djamor]|nr:hypothetical protein ONZ45_g17893 [Pleurotus djamor]